MSQLGEISEISTGELLDGRYRLEERVGEGGAARVYRAQDTLLGRTVAVKVLRGPVDDLVTGERVQSEIALLASVNHHGLVTLFDARVSHDEGSYLVMEYVEGITLLHRILQGPIDPAETAKLAVDIAEGLHVAHSSGIVHRDIKPANILLWESPVPGQGWHAKIADFGIAYLLDTARVTTPGLLVGTVAYVAPEQARGAPPAPAADIYSFGMVLIEALTGTRPFADVEGFATVMARLQTPPPIPDDLDEGWRQLLRGMTALRPEDRPTALEVAVAASKLTTAPQMSLAPTLDDSTVATVMPEPTGTTRLMPLSTSAVSAVTAAVDGSTLPVVEQRRAARKPGRARVWAIALGSVAVAAIVGLVIWASALSPSASVPNPTRPAELTVVEPTVEPTVQPTPETPAQIAPVDDGASNPGTSNSGPGTDKGTPKDNSGPGKNSGKGKGKTKP
jgi:serine/threonine protein kinase